MRSSKLDVKQFKVLVADDSRLVCNSIVVTLREIGFDSNNIMCAYKPTDVINFCKNYQFDIVICDYNFNAKLNGYQLLEELKSMKLLTSQTFFAFLTGENQPKVVRSIIDSEPDDYLLKPFNKPFLSSRLYSGLRRKRALAPIYQALQEQDYQAAVDECENLKPFLAEYALTIGLLKARSLTALKEYRKAVEEYELLLQAYESDLLKVRLAHVLIAINERERASGVLTTLDNRDNNPYFHDEMASISLQKGELAEAITHLKKATLLMEVGAERELIVSNLSLAIENYEDAFAFIKRYTEKNEWTFRDNEHINLNYVRCFLYRFNESDASNNFENQLVLIASKINALSKHQSLSFQSELLNIHIHIVRDELRQASTKLADLAVVNDMHFYDYYHYVYLLDKLGLSKQIIDTLPNMRRSIRGEQGNNIKRSQEHMAQNFEQLHANKQQKIREIKEALAQLSRQGEKDNSVFLELYVQLKGLMPHSVKVRLAIIRLVADNDFPAKDYKRLCNVLAECHRVILTQLTSSEKNRMNYKELYAKAMSNVA